jgi:hypothetical protein
MLSDNVVQFKVCIASTALQLMFKWFVIFFPLVDYRSCSWSIWSSHFNTKGYSETFKCQLWCYILQESIQCENYSKNHWSCIVSVLQCPHVFLCLMKFNRLKLYNLM